MHAALLFAGSLLGQAPPAPPPVVSKEKSVLTFYGFLRLDLFYDTSRPQNPQIPVWILSEDVNPNEGGEDDFTMSARLTRLGMDLDGPVVAELGDAKTSAKLEFDFYNLNPGALTNSPATGASREIPRLRHAWGKVDWGLFSFLAGQREDVIAPLAPTPNGDMVMWGAGNLGDRRPQLRPELKWEGLTVTGMIGVTGADDQADADTNGILDGEASGRPTLQGRIGYEFDGWVEKKKFAIGLWGHWAREHLDNEAAAQLAAFDGETDPESTALGADVTIWLHDQVSIRAELWSGRNVDDVRGGIFQGLAADGDEIEARGGWVEVGVQLFPWGLTVLGASLDDPDDEDLPSFATTAPFSAGPASRDRNLIFYWANRLRFGPLEIGADYLHWTTEFLGPGVDDGVDHRFNLFFAYWF